MAHKSPRGDYTTRRFCLQHHSYSLWRSLKFLHLKATKILDTHGLATAIHRNDTHILFVCMGSGQDCSASASAYVNFSFLSLARDCRLSRPPERLHFPVQFSSYDCISPKLSLSDSRIITLHITRIAVSLDRSYIFADGLFTVACFTCFNARLVRASNVHKSHVYLW